MDPMMVRQYTLVPYGVIFRGEYYRIVTSAFLHGGALHLGVNMLSTVTISSSLERRFGTVRMGALLLWVTLLSGSVHCAVAMALPDQTYMYQHSLGFSGVLFALIVSETWRSNSSRSLFGVIEVSSSVYPLAALVAMQLLVPNVSLLGHLGGLLVGVAEYYGLLHWLLPSAQMASRIDAIIRCGEAYVPCPAEQPALGRPIEAILGAFKTMCHLLAFVASYLGLAACASRLHDAVWCLLASCRRPERTHEGDVEAAMLPHPPKPTSTMSDSEPAPESVVI